ncbi:AFG1-like ATPase family protein [Candida albicans]|uniref:AFG1-like ATPase family protein n=1 Tax=Candida albicans TaxID=5476 RepID=A0A8H6F6I6_CANAX|nr:AFG1-like ATPase family protein [Candida albicans]
MRSIKYSLVKIPYQRSFFHTTSIRLQNTVNSNSDNAIPNNHITPLELYNQRVAENKLRDDPYQRKIITSLSKLHEKLTSYTPPKVITPSISDLTPKIGIAKIFSSFLGKTSIKNNSPSSLLVDEQTLLTVSNEVRGIYLYGDVGCGKTMLMDLFYDTIPENLPKKRLHFHQFMQNLHKRSHQLKIQHNDIDVIPLLASEIAQTSTILCFDEFQVTDVADAMLLRRLMMLLLSPQFGVILFATSNRAPDDLYLNGIQRVSFIPCIKLIKRQCHVIYLNSPTDYRKIPKPISSVYYFPKPGLKWDSKINKNNCIKHIESWYEYFNANNVKSDERLKNYKVEVWGRQLNVPICSPHYVAQFTFHELCGTPMAAGDYLALAQSFQSFIITDIPYLSIDVRDQVRRFITFLDAIYDNHGRIAVTSANSFKDLFVEPENIEKDNYYELRRRRREEEDDELVIKHGFDKSIARKAKMFVNDEERFAFARALSRLSQMSTTEWIDQVRDV